MTRAELLALVRATGCAREIGDTIFLCDPNWSAAEQSAFTSLITDNPSPITPSALRAEGWLAIRTGGSTGGLKFARHDEHTLTAAAEGFRTHFGLPRVNAVDVLPAYHVSGLMARVRCAVSGGTHVAWKWKDLESGVLPARPTAEDGRQTADQTSGSAGRPWPPYVPSELISPSSAVGRPPSDSWVLSLVPTQLHRLLANPAAIAWLRRFEIIFLGGGPAWPALTDAAAAAGLRVSLSYGMTETAAMVAAQRPEEFLAGDRTNGTALPHAQLSIAPDGRVAIAAASLFRDYVGASDCPPSAVRPPPSVFLTEDLGELTSDRHLLIHGRADAVIITGGKKVQPTEVEAALRASGEFTDVAVIGVPDPEWGEAVIACYPATAAKKPDEARAVEQLAAYQRPKRFVAIEHWPRNAQGKVNRAQLREACLRQSP